VREEGITLFFKIDTKISGPHAEEGFSGPMETPDGVIRMIKLLSRQGTNDLDDLHLGKGIELIELLHTLLAEI
jgi:hypothetical protein